MAGFHLRFKWPKWQPASNNCSKLGVDIFFFFFVYFLLNQPPGSAPSYAAQVPTVWILNSVFLFQINININAC